MIWGSLRRAYFSSELSVTASVIVIRNIHFLQAVAIEVPFDRILNGVGALEEFGTFLLLVSAAVGIQVFIEEFPHIIRQAEDFQIFGILESVLEFLGHSSEIFGFSHDFADQSLLAIKIVIVEFFIDILEHGDPLDDVHSLVAIGIIVGSIFLIVVWVLSIWILAISVISVVCRAGAQKPSDIYQVANNSQENESAQKCQGSCSAGCVKVEESSLRFIGHSEIFLIAIGGRGEAE